MTAGLVALSGGAVTALSPTASADTAPPDAATPPTVAADALPTVQVDGVVWTQAVVGNTVYAGGKFTTARPAGSAAGTNTVTRNNLLAYDIRTGDLITSFAPNLNGQVLAIAPSPDGSRIYVAGEFTLANGVNRYRIAAYSTSTGALVTTWAPALDFRARALVVTSSAVYVGGAFSTANNVARTRLAAFNPTNGALLSWAPTADAQVMAMTLTPDGSRIVVGGQFAKLNGTDAYGMGALDVTTGALKPWAANAVLRNGGANAAINSLETDGTAVYGSGYVFGPGGNIEGGFSLDPADGSVNWIADCHGDHYSGAPIGGVYYTVGHAHYCGNVPNGFPQTDPWTFHRALAFTTQATGTLAHNSVGSYADFGGRPSPTLLDWYPDFTPGTATGQDQAAWSIAGTKDYVIVGGEFPKVNGAAQQGLVRFALRPTAPNKVGPALKGSAFVPDVATPAGGTVRISWPANWDQDNEALTYSLVRDGSTIWTTSARSTFYQRSRLGYTDTGLTPGTTYRYRIQATDPLGNTATGDYVSVTATSGAALSPYASAVLGTGAAPYWRLDDAAGTTVADAAGALPGTSGSGVGHGAGAIAGDTDTAATFDGTVNGRIASSGTAVAGPNVFSVEAWFRTTTTTGGKIMGFGNAASGSSSSYDRHVYMDNAGRLRFGVYTKAVHVVGNGTAYNDGAWHHVVGTLGPQGLAFYVDGALAGSDPATTSAQGYNGYWRVGGDTLGTSWPGTPTSSNFAGSIDEVAVYSTALTAAQVQDHYVRGTKPAAANQPPAASFTASASGLVASFDASASADPDGSVASYAWDFGDGASGSGVKPSHTYAAAGSYPVVLTVTDDKGATATATKTVAVAAANKPPTASFTVSSSELAASFDASASSDADGTVASYAWAFGDGATGSGRTASHAYAAAGTYTVTLTVTDDAGATATATRSVTVAATTVLASDAFGRTVSGGLGSADTGGAWSVTGGASNFSVGGGVGKVALTAAGAGPTAFLGSVSSSSATTAASFSLDKLANGGGAYVSLVGRRVSATADYRVKVVVGSTGAVTASLVAISGSTQTTLQSATVSGVTYAAGDVLRVKIQVTGTSPTTIAAKVWKGGPAEPSSWLLSRTDSTSGLQTAGSVGIAPYLSGSATNAPVTVSVDDLATTAG
ncbi:MAG TPA: PKD domain-containing protein [Kineosporiaceae bacterium]|nr:PKD domain-containing protein [Kineosporiaceae bacterium]